MKNVAIIGAGLQCKRRIQPILNDPEWNVSWIIDLDEKIAKEQAKQCSAQTSTNWEDAIKDSEVDAVLVLTFPDTHAEISITAMEAGKDVLCEKPLARTNKEAKTMVAVANKNKRILKTGFNHRHHPAILEAHKLFTEGIIGKPVFGRGKYGIAGRTGIQKEWRSDKNIVSGGQLVDMGIHLVDIFRWFMGDIVEVAGMRSTLHWPIKVEENGFALMKSKSGAIASVHSSVTQWINTFEFELYGEKGSLTAQGLGGSYGVEKLIVNISDPNGPFAFNTIEFRGGDTSWNTEWVEFTNAIKTRKQPLGSGEDGYEALRIVHAAYEAGETGRYIQL